MVNRKRAAQQLELHEGLRTTAYVDTLGNWTIGVGYNITGRGYDFLEKVLGRRIKPADGLTEKVRITEDEARRVLMADIERIEPVILVYFPEYTKLIEVRQRVVLDMAFNMGFKVLGFKNTIAAVKRGDWSAAVKGLYASKWAYQVDDGPGAHFGRCDRLGRMLLTGNDYTV
jgi:lysozyme